MNKNKAGKINKDAISEIEKDLDKAFFMFGLNYKMNYDWNTAHNFGSFLSKYNHECVFSNNKLTIAQSLLEEAIKIHPNFLSYKELGDMFFIAKQYKPAIANYYDALKFKKTTITLANMGFCYFYNRDYTSSTHVLCDAINKGDVSGEILTNIFLTIAFAYLCMKDKKNGRKIFKELTKASFCVMSPELLQLAYMCDEYEYVVINSSSIISNWILDETTLKVICQSYFISDDKKLEYFIDDFRSYMINFKNDNPDFNLSEIDKLLDVVENKSYIPNINYEPQYIWQIDFIDI